ncbi:MAG: sigma factor G inhibitor Gin [Thermincolia bacterium]
MTTDNENCVFCGSKKNPWRSRGGFYLKGQFVCPVCEGMMIKCPVGSRFYQVPLQGIKKIIFQ